MFDIPRVLKDLLQNKEQQIRNIENKVQKRALETFSEKIVDKDKDKLGKIYRVI